MVECRFLNVGEMVDGSRGLRNATTEAQLQLEITQQWYYTNLRFIPYPRLAARTKGS